MLDVAAAQFHWEVRSEEMVESNENVDAKSNMKMLISLTAPILFTYI